MVVVTTDAVRSTATEDNVDDEDDFLGTLLRERDCDLDSCDDFDDDDVVGFTFRSLGGGLDTRIDDEDVFVLVFVVSVVAVAGDCFRRRGLDKLLALRGSVTCVDRDR